MQAGASRKAVPTGGKIFFTIKSLYQIAVIIWCYRKNGAPVKLKQFCKHFDEDNFEALEIKKKGTKEKRKKISIAGFYGVFI